PPTRPRSRLPALPPRAGDRSVHERPGVPSRARRAVRRRAAGARRSRHLGRGEGVPRDGTALPREPAREPPLGRATDRGAPLRRDVPPAVAQLGRCPPPARADEAAAPPEGNPAPGRRAPP